MFRVISVIGLLVLGACVGDAEPVIVTDSEPAPNSISGDVIAVSAGHGMTCAINRDGSIACWNYFGDDLPLPPAGSFTAIAAGYSDACALRSDGSLACWGHPQLGAYLRDTMPSGRFIALTYSGLHACALRLDRTATCWSGPNGWGQADPPPGTFIDISANGSATCGVRDNGALECWGNSESYFPPVPSGAFTKVVLDHNSVFACALDGAGYATCWTTRPDLAAHTPPPDRFTQVTLAYAFACGIRQLDGAIKCWGNDSPAFAPPAGRFITIEAGLYHMCAVRDDGAVACWGSNLAGDITPPPAVPR